MWARCEPPRDKPIRCPDELYDARVDELKRIANDQLLQLLGRGKLVPKGMPTANCSRRSLVAKGAEESTKPNSILCLDSLKRGKY